jgi:hypothetical protein
VELLSFILSHTTGKGTRPRTRKAVQADVAVAMLSQLCTAATSIYMYSWAQMQRRSIHRTFVFRAGAQLLDSTTAMNLASLAKVNRQALLAPLVGAPRHLVPCKTPVFHPP